MTDTCQNCRYWQPLFSGEAWNVRSFAGAPEIERTAIAEKLAAYEKANNGWADPEAALDWHSGLADTADSGARDVPGGADWPYWGECELTSLGWSRRAEKPVSLARAIDGSAYRAVLRTRCSFSCVQWSPVQ